MTLTPPSASVLLGNQLTFTVTVKNTTDMAVTWSVNGTAGGSPSLGSISSVGVYTAPRDLPEPANLQITATSHADPKKSASAMVTIQSDITVTLISSAAVEVGASQNFQASVSSSAHPDPTITWSVSGPSCPLACGSVDADGNFNAPQILPSPPTVTIIARSVADLSKQAFATITITSNFLLQLSVPANVAAGSTATFIATFTPIPASNPSMALAWSLAGVGCGGTSCGTLTVMTTKSAGSGTTATSASYTAPVAAPNPNSVTVTVTPQADPAKFVQQSFTILGSSNGVSLSLSPASATRAINHRVTLTAQLSGTSSSNVTWNVGGISGGNAAIGQICAVGSNPCQPVATGNILEVDYLAPSAVPTPNPATVQVVSAADVTKTATSPITIISHVIVSVLPGSALLVPLSVQAFTAAVLGTANQNLVWQLQGSGCTSAGACGTLTPAGVYTAPGAAPTPNALQVVAISSDDTSQAGIANVTISTGLNILTLHPASVYAGAAAGFVLKVIGSSFRPSTGADGSLLLIDGTARTTTCDAQDTCTAPVTPSDVAVPGSVTVQVQNPDGKKSNPVSLVIAPPNISDEAIPLTAGAPDVTGKDIVVVEPTTAGVSVRGNSVDLDVAALGIFSVVNNSCTLGGNPIVLIRPTTASATADICIFAQSGLDSSMTYSITGPDDVSVIAKQPLGFGIIRLTLRISSAAIPSARTLFVQNTNLDKTAASGTLRVK